MSWVSLVGKGLFSGALIVTASEIVWLMIPSLMIFLITPWMLRRDYAFEVSMTAGIVCTIILYAVGAWAAQSIGQVS